MLNGSFVIAELNTKVTFERPGGIVNIIIGIEDHLGLERESYFLSGAFLYRFTPRSGIYANYYGFNRSNTTYTDQDFHWGGDTIPAGTGIEVFFRTQVLSGGYLLTLLEDSKSFFGTYFNVYVMPIQLGVRSGIFDHDLEYVITTPLPNIGVIALFSLTKWKWLEIHGKMGFFSLYIDAGGGYINDFELAFLFKATRWLNFHLSYKKFNVNVVFPTEPIETSVTYSYKGPTLGVTLIF